MIVDLAINPFDADVAEMVDLAVAAEEIGHGAVWVADHFSGAVVGRRWSRDPWVCLGAMAVATERIDLGILVANMRNRHPAQLASAANSLQSLAPGRVRIGIGSGAVPGSRFAIEHDAIGTDLGSAASRRAMLADSVRALRSIWAGERDLAAAVVGFDGLEGVVDGAPCPPIVIGGSAWPTIEVALRYADGVNVRRTTGLREMLERIGRVRPAGFEVSVLDGFDDVADDPSTMSALTELGVDRLVLGMSPPHDIARLARLEIV